MGPWAIVLLTVVALACGLAAYAVVRGDWRTLIGLPIAGAVIAYLLTPRVRRYIAACG